MKRITLHPIWLVFIVLLFNFSCVTKPDTPEQLPPEEEESDIAASLPVPEPGLEEEPETPEDIPPVPEEPVLSFSSYVSIIPTVENVEWNSEEFPEPPVYKATEEEFTRTFEAIEEFISDLNSIIANRRYSEWRRYLSNDFIMHYQSPEILGQYSDMQVLKQNGIVLSSLSDYFRYVVVPSRSNARLDDLEFVDDTHIKAIMVIEGQRIILYSLEKVNEQWKIGYW